MEDAAEVVLATVKEEITDTAAATTVLARVDVAAVAATVVPKSSAPN